jgi:hypothetical protein
MRPAVVAGIGTPFEVTARQGLLAGYRPFLAFYEEPAP